MPAEDNSTDSIKQPVKAVTAEAVSELVSRIVRTAARNALNELKKELKEKSLKVLQRRLSNLSQKKLEQLLDGEITETAGKIAHSVLPAQELIDTIESELRQKLKRRLLKMIRPPVMAITAAATAIVLVAIITIIAAAVGGDGGSPGEEDSTPPEVEVFLSSESPAAGEPVIFSVESSDDTGVVWMELIINGETVAEDDDSPLVYSGGPYEPGTIIRYSAFAYDDIGNSGWTGERTLVIQGDAVPPLESGPDLVILEAWFEPIIIDRPFVGSFHYIIQNVGDFDSGTSVSYLSFDNEIIQQESVGPLSPEESSERILTITDITNFSPALFRICADGGNSTPEINEDNNCLEFVP